MKQEFQSPEIKHAFDAFPEDARRGVLILRALIFTEAATLPQIGGLIETLKWGQPAYLAVRPRTSTTLRLGQPKGGGFALFAHCQSTVISSFHNTFPGMDTIQGNRAVCFSNSDEIAPDRLRILIRHALTYYLT